MSKRLQWLTFLMLHVTRQWLAATKDVFRARKDFESSSRFARVAPYLLHLSERGTPDLHYLSVRRGNAGKVVLYFHGGAYVMGSARTHLAPLSRLARLTGLQIVVPDYRLAPEHPAPAAFQDAVAAHVALLAKGYQPQDIILGGDSAGGGLALALMADLCARNLRPAGLFAFSPWTDFAMSGDSLRRNAAIDPALPVGRMRETVDLVLQGFPPQDPRISPLYAPFNAPPPVFVQVGAEEILLDDSFRMAQVLRDAGGQVTCDVWNGCPHVWHMLDGYIPEARAALVATAAFVATLQALVPIANR